MPTLALLLYLLILGALWLFRMAYVGWLGSYLFACALVVPPVLLLMSLPSMLRLKLELEVAPTLTRNAEGKLTVRFLNRSLLPLHRVSVWLEVENRFTGDVKKDRFHYQALVSSRAPVTSQVSRATSRASQAISQASQAKAISQVIVTSQVMVRVPVRPANTTPTPSTPQMARPNTAMSSMNIRAMPLLTRKALMTMTSAVSLATTSATFTVMVKAAREAANKKPLPREANSRNQTKNNNY